jgi:hypothetical protein
MKLPDHVRGDAPCHRCGTHENIVWFTDNVLWNEVIRSERSEWKGGEPILCINCFVALVESRFQPTGWRLIPAWPWRERADPAKTEGSET